VPGRVIWSRRIRKRAVPLQQDEQKLLSNIESNKLSEKNSLVTIKEQSVNCNREAQKKMQRSNIPTSHQSKVEEQPAKAGHPETIQRRSS